MSRPTIGLLVDWLEDEYQNCVFSGALEAARAADVNLICFAGGVLDSPDGFGARRNGVYDLANEETVDGLVLLSGTIGNHVGPDVLARYCARFDGLPTASVGVALPGIPSFLVDNSRGLEAALLHLIQYHGHRHIAFVRGPAVNAEAEQRYDTYRETLAQCGLPFDPNLVAPGNFQARAGAAAVRTLLNDRGVTFDALVAANDDMALGAMAALQGRKIAIPDQVAVVGFDDVEVARFAAVPMATVRQPLREQGLLATKSVIDRLGTSARGSDVVLPSQFVPRHSCGCRGGERTLPSSSGSPSYDVALAGDADDASGGLNAERTQARRRLEAEEWIRRLRRTGEVLMTSFEAGSLATALEEQLPRLDIPSCFLAVFADSPSPEPSVAGRPARLLLAYDARSDASPLEKKEKEEVIFPSRLLVPPHLLPANRNYGMVVEPLFFDEQPLGFVVLEVGPQSGVVYEALRSQIATALKGALLVAQVHDEAQRRAAEEKTMRHAQKMEAVGTLAAGIAHEINTPMQYTTDTVHFLKDVHTTLGQLLAAYKDRAGQLAEASGQSGLRESWDAADREADLDYFLAEAEPAFERALEGLGRVGTIVRAMKDFAHPGGGDMAPADVNRALTSTIHIARNEYKFVAEVVTAFEPLPPVACHIGDLNQVFLNLLVNAAHAIQDVVKTSGAKGEIRVATKHVGEHVEISISDTGCGIPAAVLERIYDPFFTTKEIGKGTGQGLAIARSIVVDRHGGTLTCDSRVGQGTTFTIRIPVEGRPPT